MVLTSQDKIVHPVLIVLWLIDVLLDDVWATVNIHICDLFKIQDVVNVATHSDFTWEVLGGAMVCLATLGIQSKYVRFFVLIK